MPIRLRTLTLIILIAVAACAATTTFTSTWRAPDVPAISPVGKTVATVFVSRDESKRRAGEDAMARSINAFGGHGLPAYTVLPNEAAENADTARAKLKEAGANGVVTMRVVGKDQQVTYTPGYTAPSYYGGFGPYWGYGWGTVSSPGYLQTDTLVSVETLVYSLDRDKLLWASTSRTTNPENLDSLIKEIADATANEMVKQGLLAPPPGK
ncbi:MAG TPA: hypothetical protein VKB72_09230 [Steroidobacteraceae bacterium]|nr:hypothetical protein [Steroidobacteraceae bacterium]